MNYTIITSRVDAETKREATELSSELGLSLSETIKVLLTQFIKSRQISVGTDEMPNEYLRSVMKKSAENYRKGEVSPKFNIPSAAQQYLEEHGV